MTFNGVLGLPTPPSRRPGFVAVGNDAGASATVPLGPNHMVFQMLRFGSPIVATHLMYRVHIQSGNMCLNLYEPGGTPASPRPGKLITTTGGFTVPAAGGYFFELGAEVPVWPGAWVSLQADNTTAQFRTTSTGTGPLSSSYLDPGVFPFVSSVPASTSLVVDSRAFELTAVGWETR